MFAFLFIRTPCWVIFFILEHIHLDTEGMGGTFTLNEKFSPKSFTSASQWSGLHHCVRAVLASTIRKIIWLTVWNKPSKMCFTDLLSVWQSWQLGLEDTLKLENGKRRWCAFKYKFIFWNLLAASLWCNFYFECKSKFIVQFFKLHCCSASS